VGILIIFGTGLYYQISDSDDKNNIITSLLYGLNTLGISFLYTFPKFNTFIPHWLRYRILPYLFILFGISTFITLQDNSYKTEVNFTRESEILQIKSRYIKEISVIKNELFNSDKPNVNYLKTYLKN
jgi:hypothetical protein